MALLLTLLTTYILFSGWKYTPFVLTNQNHHARPKLNDTLFFWSVLDRYISSVATFPGVKYVDGGILFTTKCIAKEMTMVVIGDNGRLDFIKFMKDMLTKSKDVVRILYTFLQSYCPL